MAEFEELDVALFAWGSDGTATMLGRTRAPRIVKMVRDHIRNERRNDLSLLEGPLPTDDDETDPTQH